MRMIKSGKVRDIYEEDILALVTTNRVSAFDSVLPGEVPHKGTILNGISNKWMELLADQVDNHIVSYSAEVVKALGMEKYSGQTVIVKKYSMLPVECIVRGYYIPTSKSWDSYKVDSTIQGIKLPEGLKESEKLPQPIFTPTTKGEKDIPLTYDQCVIEVMNFLANSNAPVTGSLKDIALMIVNVLENTSISLYDSAYKYAYSRGIILADSKLEFGIEFDENGNFNIVLCDEAFTPDSSRYWDLETYEVGKTQASMDKQYLRDYLKNDLKWSGLKDGPVPNVPNQVYERLSLMYDELLYKLFDCHFEDL